MLARIRELVDAEWETRLGVERSVLRGGGVHVVAADLGANDAMSFLLADTCILAVRASEIEKAREVVSGLDAEAAFSPEVLRSLVGPDGQVDGPSIHTYADQESFRGTSDPAATAVAGNDVELIEFLRSNDVSDWAESGFPRDPSTADRTTTEFWLLRRSDEVVAGGNLTEWRGHPADVGVLTIPSARGQGLGGRLVGAMVSDALPRIGVARYRALASNTASLALASRLGFVDYGSNFRARRTVN